LVVITSVVFLCLLFLALSDARTVNLKTRVRQKLAHKRATVREAPCVGANAACVPAPEGTADATATGDNYVETGGITTCLVVITCESGANRVHVSHYALPIGDNSVDALARVPNALKWATTIANIKAAARVHIIGAIGNWAVPVAGNEANLPTAALAGTAATAWRDWALQYLKGGADVDATDRDDKDYRISPKDCKIYEKATDNGAPWGDPLTASPLSAAVIKT